MFRIHLTTDDLARVRVMPTIGPFAETLLALTVLQRRWSSLFLPWVRAVRGRVPVVPPVIRDIAPLVGSAAPLLDFLTPAGTLAGIDEGIDSFLAASPDRLGAEVAYVARYRSVPTWAHDIGGHGPHGRLHFARAAMAAHDTLIAPHWTQMRVQLEAQRAVRGRQLLDGGLGGMLSRLHPAIHWNPPALDMDTPEYIPGSGDFRETHLAGEGLDIIASVFCQEPQFYSSPNRDQPALVIYPAVPDLATAHALWTADVPERQALAQLLGSTRATVLHTIADRPGVTGGELARAAGISPASASEHTTALRRSGLIMTRSEGRFRLHHLTPNGEALLQGSPLVGTTPAPRGSR